MVNLSALAVARAGVDAGEVVVASLKPHANRLPTGRNGDAARRRVLLVQQDLGVCGIEEDVVPLDESIRVAAPAQRQRQGEGAVTVGIDHSMSGRIRRPLIERTGHIQITDGALGGIGERVEVAAGGPTGGRQLNGHLAVEPGQPFAGLALDAGRAVPARRAAIHAAGGIAGLPLLAQRQVDDRCGEHIAGQPDAVDDHEPDRLDLCGVLDARVAGSLEGGLGPLERQGIQRHGVGLAVPVPIERHITGAHERDLENLGVAVGIAASGHDPQIPVVEAHRRGLGQDRSLTASALGRPVLNRRARLVDIAAVFDALPIACLAQGSNGGGLDAQREGPGIDLGLPVHHDDQRGLGRHVDEDQIGVAHRTAVVIAAQGLAAAPKRRVDNGIDVSVEDAGVDPQVRTGLDGVLEDAARAIAPAGAPLVGVAALGRLIHAQRPSIGGPQRVERDGVGTVKAGIGQTGGAVAAGIDTQPAQRAAVSQRVDIAGLVTAARGNRDNLVHLGLALQILRVHSRNAERDRVGRCTDQLDPAGEQVVGKLGWLGKRRGQPRLDALAVNVEINGLTVDIEIGERGAGRVAVEIRSINEQADLVRGQPQRLDRGQRRWAAQQAGARAHPLGHADQPGVTAAHLAGGIARLVELADGPLLNGEANEADHGLVEAVHREHQRAPGRRARQ